MNSQIFNRPLILARKQSLQLEDQFFYALLFDDLLERCTLLTRTFAHTLIIAPPFSQWKAALTATGKFPHITWVWHTPCPSADMQPYVQRTDEALPFEADQFDYIISLAELAWINDIPAILHQTRACLKPDGLFMALFAGGNTLTELRQCLIQAESELRGGISAHIHPMMEVRAMGSLLQHAGFALPVVDVETHTIRYQNITRLFEDIKAHGASNALNGHKPPIHRAVFARTLELYAEKFSELPIARSDLAEGDCPPRSEEVGGSTPPKYHATLEIIAASGWAPHASQQQPLKPGSAKVSLKDVLGQ